MLLKDIRNLKTAQVEQKEITFQEGDNTHSTEQADIRRLMYERIARGNMMAEVEETAREKWHRK